MEAGLVRVSELLDERLTATTLGEEISTRLHALESRLPILEAEVKGELLKAEQERKVARSAEERARGVLKRAESLAGDEDGDDEGDDWEPPVAGGNGEAGSYEAMQPVPAPMDRNAQKQAARQAGLSRKWGF